jgi:hypothetical protein
MADKKQPYTWTRVKPGDIISFRYKPKSKKPPKMNTVLVLNPKFPMTLKNGKIVRQLIGLKLEESNRVALRITRKLVNTLEQVGTFKVIDEKNSLFKLEVKKQFVTNEIKGVKPRVYDILSKSLGLQGQYRTYDYDSARRSSVYLEPIVVARDED